LRNRSDQVADRRPGPIGVQRRDEFGDQDDHHQDRPGDRLTAEHRD